jgi:hypothetical protein
MMEIILVIMDCAAVITDVSLVLYIVYFTLFIRRKHIALTKFSMYTTK